MYKSKVCPQCQSFEVEEFSSHGLESEFVCKKCGFKFKSSARFEAREFK